jgi:lipoyl(octanoyl) transferase
MCIPYELVSVIDRIVPYAEGLDLQNRIHSERRQHQRNDTVLILEHEPVVTIGRGSHPERDFLSSAGELARKGIEIFEADRGGELTYHAPGQIVFYPIIELNEERGERDLHEYLRKLEQVVIESLAELDMAAHRIPGRTGVWVRNQKIAAVGIKVTRWITMHGFALNVDVDLSPMRTDIVPCGINDLGVTSIAEQGIKIDRAMVEGKLVRSFERIFHRETLS